MYLLGQLWEVVELIESIERGDLETWELVKKRFKTRHLGVPTYTENAVLRDPKSCCCSNFEYHVLCNVFLEKRATSVHGLFRLLNFVSRASSWSEQPKNSPCYWGECYHDSLRMDSLFAMSNLSAFQKTCLPWLLVRQPRPCEVHFFVANSRPALLNFRLKSSSAKLPRLLEFQCLLHRLNLSFAIQFPDMVLPYAENLERRSTESRRGAHH